MFNLAYIHFFQKTTFRILLISCCVTSLISGSYTPLLLNGNMEFSLNTQDNGIQTQTGIDQQYNIHLQKYFTPYVGINTSMIYSQQRLNLQDNISYNRVYQPLGDISWNNPYFSMGAFANRRFFKSNTAAGNFNREDTGVQFSSKYDKIPRLTLRYENSSNYNPENISLRNNGEKRWQLGISDNFASSTANYGFHHNEHENRLTSATTIGNSHRFRWDQRAKFLKNKLRFSSGYTLNYNTDEFINPDSLNSQQTISSPIVYSSVDITPESGTMNIVRGLNDGDITLPVTPEIQLGSEFLYRNFAFDMGFSQEVTGAFIYTDTMAAISGSWDIYSSQDFIFSEYMVWIKEEENVEALYNDEQSRIELSFSSLESRFIKIVNVAYQDFNTVKVTEVQVFHTNSEYNNGISRYSSQSINVGNTFKFSKNYSISTDIVFQNEPFKNTLEKKKMIFSLHYQAGNN